MYVPSPMPMPVIPTPQLRTLAELWGSKRRDDAIPCRSDFSDDELRPWFTAVVSDHLLGYGHGAIYAQKAFQLLARLGWERADTVLLNPHKWLGAVLDCSLYYTRDPDHLVRGMSTNPS